MGTLLSYVTSNITIVNIFNNFHTFQQITHIADFYLQNLINIEADKTQDKKINYLYRNQQNMNSQLKQTTCKIVHVKVQYVKFCIIDMKSNHNALYQKLYIKIAYIQYNSTLYVNNPIR